MEEFVAATYTVAAVMAKPAVTKIVVIRDVLLVLLAARVVADAVVTVVLVHVAAEAGWLSIAMMVTPATA